MQEYFFTERQIYYRKNEFSSDKQTLVFIHGVSGSSAAWLPYEKKFENEYNILSLDLRGHGKSAKPLEYESYKIELFAEDIYELMQYLHVQKCILISHSFGSFIALAFLDKYQEMVSKVVLISPQYSVNNMPQAKIAKPFIYGLVSILPALKSTKVGGHIDYLKYKNSGDWNIPRMYADITNTDLRVYLYCSKQTYMFDGQEILKKIQVPTLIIHGENDSIFPVKYAKEMNTKIKNSKIEIIKNSNHILVLNNFNEVSNFIEKFVTSGTDTYQ